MTEELKPESTELIVLPIEEQISQELVKANVTEAVIGKLKEKYLPLKIAGIEDKETYLLVKEGRKECKSIRVMASKICKKGRENAVAIQKAWVGKEKDVTDRIAEVEDHLEKQEKDFEAQVAKEKEDRKRKQEEQLINRQQTLATMGVLYSEGNFTLGEVSFDFSLVKESEEDIWQEIILPKFKEEYEKVQAEYIESKRQEQEKAEELKRQQEELEQKKKELAEEAERLQQESARQALEADKRRAAMIENRTSQLVALGFKNNMAVGYVFHEYTIIHEDIHEHTNEKWQELIAEATEYVDTIKKEIAEAQKIEQDRKELQNKRYAEMFPYKEFGSSVQVETLWSLAEDEYSSILLAKKSAYEYAEEEKKQKIADDAAKKERERIEEEQRKAENKRITELRSSRMLMLKNNDLVYHGDCSVLGIISEEAWMKDFNELKDERDEIIRKQEEERKAEELAQATDKHKWGDMLGYLNNLIIHEMRSGQYRKKAAILREKLEEIKAL